MKLKRIIALLLASSLLLALLTACSQTAEETTEETATEETTTEETTTDEVAFDYSSYFTQEGYFKGVTATDYITLPDYSAQTLPEDTLVAPEAEITSEINAVLASYTTHDVSTSEDYVIADGDTVNIDYVGSVDGVEFDGGSTGGAGTDVTIGTTQYIDDFLAQLIGHKIGENFDIEVTFPEDYGVEELNGKDAIFNITINHTYETVVPELTDEFVAETFAGVYTTAQEVTDIIAEGIVYNKQVAYVRDFLIDVEVSEYPEELLTFVQESTLNDLSTSAAQYGMDLATYVSLIGYTDLDTFIEESKADFEALAKEALVYQAVMEEADFELTEEIVMEYTDLIFGAGTYDSAVLALGYNYIASIVSQNLAVEEVHKIMIENTDGATLPDFYVDATE